MFCTMCPIARQPHLGYSATRNLDKAHRRRILKSPLPYEFLKVFGMVIYSNDAMRPQAAVT